MALVKIAVPVRKPEDDIPHLGSPTHWKQGRSAKALADAWYQANDFPPRVRAILQQDPTLSGVDLIDVWLDWKERKARLEKQMRSTDRESSIATPPSWKWQIGGTE